MNIFKKLFKKKKSKIKSEDLIDFYMIIDNREYPNANLSNEEDLNKFTKLAIVASLAEAKEFVLTYLRLEKIDHFKSWCERQNKDFTKPDNFIEYLNLQYEDGIDYLGYFLYIPVAHSRSDMASYLRIFYNCKPIGCSYETLEELSINKIGEIIEENAKQIHNNSNTSFKNSLDQIDNKEK